MGKKIFTILLLLCLFACAWGRADDVRALSVAERNAQMGFNDTIDRMADDFVEAYVMIANPGNYLYTTLGHAAYHMKCPTFGLDYYFSMEGENVPDAVFRFVAGKLKMGLVGIPAKDYLTEYEKDHRGVKEYKLNLSPVQKQKLWEVLDNSTDRWHNVPYDYFHRSCALALVDVMNETVGKENIHYPTHWPEKYNHTAGDLVYFQLRSSAPWTLSLMRILCGTEANKDVRNERKLICPNDLVEVWQQTMVAGQPLLESSALTILPVNSQEKKSVVTPLFVSVILLVFALLSIGSMRTGTKWIRICGHVIDYAILGIVTLLGLFLTYLIFVSNLPCTEWNWLWIAFNPLPAIFWGWRKHWAVPYVILMLIWVVGVIINPCMIAYSEHILLVITFSIILVKQYLINNKKLEK